MALTEDQRKLKEAAQAATPGPWIYRADSTRIDYDMDSEDNSGSITVMDSGDFTARMTDSNGQFIAAANPAVILALLAQVEAAPSAEQEPKP